MRRSTPGVVGAQDLLDARAARAEAHDPRTVIRALEPFVGDVRRARIQEVLARRIAGVTVVFDGPYDPHNGAAVLRSCDAFGLQHLHVVERPGTPFAVAHTVARGTEKWIDVTCHEGAPSLLAWAEAAGMPLVATHPEGELEPEDLRELPRFAVVLGNEREGIRPAIAAACARRVRVPMRGFVESLNVSVTCAILLHAATRGRPGDLGEEERTKLYARGLYLSVPRAEDILAHA